jgi:hypothetical protein
MYPKAAIVCERKCIQKLLTIGARPYMDRPLNPSAAAHISLHSQGGLRGCIILQVVSGFF